MKKLKKFAALLLVGVMAPGPADGLRWRRRPNRRAESTGPDQSGEGRPGDQ